MMPEREWYDIRFFVQGFVLCLMWIACFNPAWAAVRIWTGGAGDGLWGNASNWDNAQLPEVADDVLLDNSMVLTNYTVNLPGTLTTIRSIIIRPAPNQTIELLLPSTNILENAFSVTGPGYGITLERGAIFLNASGLTSGESILVADSIRINNGGKYIHNTRAAHANNIVRLLSSSPGTETGIFEFDVPRAAYTISASNRKYGSLVLSSAAAGGAVTYTCNGSNLLTINGNLQIDQGVNFSVDLGGTNGNVLIKRDLIQNGGVFNIASGMGNTTVVRINGNLIQSTGSFITETNTGLPTIELNGSASQVISLQGEIQNSVSFRINNQEGAILSSALHLPFKLELWQGRITTSYANLLTLMPTCSVQVDSSIANTSFIDGPMKKSGLQSSAQFLFPVGKNGILRWLELKNASGDYTVEYQKSNPRLLSTTYSSGIDHISAQEYWIVSEDDPVSAKATVELSFLDPGSGGVTDLPTLRVTALNATIWNDEGQTGSTGVFGAAGSVISNSIQSFSGLQYFTLASSLNLENPLPVKLRKFDVAGQGGMAKVSWEIEFPEDADHFEILQGSSETNLISVKDVWPLQGLNQYAEMIPIIENSSNYFSLKVFEKDGRMWNSKIICINIENSGLLISLFPTMVNSGAFLKVDGGQGGQGGQLNWMVIGMAGKTSLHGQFKFDRGENRLWLDLSTLAPGAYQLFGIKSGEIIFLRRFIKD
jgi:hypothetical protein